MIDCNTVSVRDVEREIEAYQRGVAAYLASRSVGECSPFDQSLVTAYVRGWEAGQKAARKPKRLKVSIYNHASCCYECPVCSCGAVLDWRNEAPLRCTGCKEPLRSAERLGA